MLAWVLTTGRGGHEAGPIPYSPDLLPLGLVVAFDPAKLPRPRPAGGAWELLVWVRGPYRTLGLGRGSVPHLLARDIIPALPKDEASKEPTVTRLVARYPQAAGTRGDRFQRTAWTYFFNDNDFVSRPADPRGPERSVVELVRDLGRPAARIPRERRPESPPPPAGGGAGPAAAGGA